MTAFHRFRTLSWLSPPLLLCASAAAAEPDFAFSDAQQFVRQFCLECHGPTKPQGGLNLQRFDSQDKLLAGRKVWDDVLQRVRDGEMPPPSKKRTPPPDAVRAAFV